MKFSFLPLLLLTSVGTTQAAGTYADQTSQINTALESCGSSVDSAAIEKELKESSPINEGSSIEFYGVKLKNFRPNLVGHMSKLIHVSDRGNGAAEKYQIKELEKEFPGINNCRDTFCIADKVFGEGNGAYYLYFLDKYNLNLSHVSNEIMYKETTLRFKGPIKYKKAELDAVYSALRILPVQYFEDFEYGSHMKRINRNKGNTIANATISYFNLWGKQSRHEKVITVIHELGHRMSDFIMKDGADFSEEWASISNWKYNRDSVYGMYFGAKRDYSKRNFVSNYAKSNPAEDFAESFTSFVLTPQFLRQVAPQKYEFMKRVVFGEPSISSLCLSGESNGLDLKLDLEDLSEDDHRELAESCLNEYITSMNESNMSEFNSCILRKVNGIDFLPLGMSSSTIKKSMRYSENYKKVMGHASDALMSTVSGIYVCDSHPSLLFNAVDDIFKDYPMSLNDLSKNACRWGKSHLRVNKLDFNEENFSNSIKKVFEMRALSN